MKKLHVLFVCTSNRDRSPALEKYFREKYPEHEYRSAGINTYLTSKKGTHLINQDDMAWTDFVVFAEDIHYAVTINKFRFFLAEKAPEGKQCTILNLGEYVRGDVNEDYLGRAEEKIKQYIT